MCSNMMHFSKKPFLGCATTISKPHLAKLQLSQVESLEFPPPMELFVSTQRHMLPFLVNPVLHIYKYSYSSYLYSHHSPRLRVP